MRNTIARHRAALPSDTSPVSSLVISCHRLSFRIAVLPRVRPATTIENRRVARPSERDDLFMVNDLHRADAQLLANIKRDLDSLTTLADRIKDEWTEGDLVYWFWHQSFKVYGIQDRTLRIVGALEAIAPEGCKLDERFRQIIAEGTGKAFEYEHNQRWLAETRPMLEAFWHADFMLRMAVRHGRGLEQAPNLLPSGWAALLYLYGLR